MLNVSLSLAIKMKCVLPIITFCSKPCTLIVGLVDLPHCNFTRVYLKQSRGLKPDVFKMTNTALMTSFIETLRPKHRVKNTSYFRKLLWNDK